MENTTTLDDIPAGTAWATRFRTTTFVQDGAPVRAHNLAIGATHPGSPELYEGLGIIKTRDTLAQYLVVVDTLSGQEFTVAYKDCWDWDTIEWTT